ncbi:hypothetical protein INR49_002402, partial [Caranx melampygus]
MTTSVKIQHTWHKLPLRFAAVEELLLPFTWSHLKPLGGWTSFLYFNTFFHTTRFSLGQKFQPLQLHTLTVKLTVAFNSDWAMAPGSPTPSFAPVEAEPPPRSGTLIQ